MGDVLDYAPLAAAGFAIPQFLPQVLKVKWHQRYRGRVLGPAHAA
jgi:hypothetical protein